jgi:hypothetical protein
MSRVWTIARRELRALFDHPTGYILLIVFLAVNNFLFFRQVFLIGAATLRPMLDLLPWVLLFLVPAVTMRALADDARTGTLEVVLAQPVTEFGWWGKHSVACLPGSRVTTPGPPAGSHRGRPRPGSVARTWGHAAVAGPLLAGTWTSSHQQPGHMFILVWP